MADIEAAARDNGMEWVFLPVESGNIFYEDVDRFDAMIQQVNNTCFLSFRNPLHRTLGTQFGTY